MNFFSPIFPLLGLGIGVAIGYGFGCWQLRARRRHEARQAAGGLRHGWSLIPGSGARVVALLLVLLGLQVVCPMLFREGVEWWVAAGVALGYGLRLALRLWADRRCATGEN